MTTSEMIAIDMDVCVGLAKKPGETILSAASRALRSSPNVVTKRAAAILLNRTGDAWGRMRRASELFRSADAG